MELNNTTSFISPENTVRIDSTDVENNSEKPMTTLKRVFCIVTVCSSSFLYGLALKMISLEFDDVLKTSTGFSTELMETLQTIAATIIFLGAGVTNLGISFFRNINIKSMMILASLIQILGYSLIVCHPHIYLYIVGKFLIGAGTGISFSYISRLLFNYANGPDITFITSLHPISIVLGLIVGQLLSLTRGVVDMRIVDLAVISFTAINAFLLKFINTGKIENRSDSSVIEVIKKKENFELLFNCIVFHIGNQLSGINYISIKTEDIFKTTAYPIIYSALALISPIPFMIISTRCLKFIKEEIKVILSCLIIGFSTLFMTFYDIPEILVFTFLFGFNIGLGYIPWGYAQQRFLAKDMNAANNLGVTVNMTLGFILSCFGFSMHYYLGNYAYLIYTTVMALITTYSVFIFKSSFKPILDSVCQVFNKV